MPELDPLHQEIVREIFDRAAFMTYLGVTLDGLEIGACSASLAVEPRHGQQDGFVHAGVLAALADHCAGGAAGTLLQAGDTVLSVEFKINLLRPAIGERLRCRATVLKPGRTIMVAESEVFAVRAGEEKLVAKSTVTLAVVSLEATRRRR